MDEWNTLGRVKRVAYNGIVHIVNASELERLKKRFMKLDACVPFFHYLAPIMFLRTDSICFIVHLDYDGYFHLLDYRINVKYTGSSIGSNAWMLGRA